MVTSLWLYEGFVAVIGVERLVELALSKRNAARAFARGALEVGQTHYRVMTGFHTLFLFACATEPLLLARRFPGPIGWGAVGGVLFAQALRYWAIATLGDRWNTRVIVLPEVAPITRGPYRFVKHPNYLAVVIEMALLPMAHGAWITAVLFSLGNAGILVVRIRAEEAALGPQYARAFSGIPRFFPESSHE